MFRPNSFQNLLRIAGDPVLRKYVKSIFYEGAMAHFRINRHVWELLVGACGIRGKIEIPPKPLCPTKPQWSSSVLQGEREMQMWEGFWGPRQAKTKIHPTQLAQGWAACDRIQRETADIMESNLDRNAIEVALQLFPNLEEISMQTDNKATAAMKRSFKGALFLPTTNVLPFVKSRGTFNLDHCYSGTRQLSSLLEASITAGHKLKSLSAAELNWFFFGDGVRTSQWVDTTCQPQHGTWERFKFSFEEDYWSKPFHRSLESAFHHLQNIDFRFESTSVEEEADDVRKILKKSVVTRFGNAIMSARNLKSLALDCGDTDEVMHCKCVEAMPVRLHTLLGKSLGEKTVWPHLTSLELHSVEASYTEWTTFFKAHSPTLRNIRLSSLWLKTEDGNESPEWSDTLLTMRRLLYGKNVDFRGVFCAVDEFLDEYYGSHEGWMAMDREIPSPYLDHHGRFKRFGDILHRWFLEDLGTNQSLVENCAKFFTYDDDDDYTYLDNGGNGDQDDHDEIPDEN